jgi:hypothetical protein
MRRPETMTLDTPNGFRLVVKKWLTAGETRNELRLMMKEDLAGRDKVDLLMVGASKVLTYLLDWNLTDVEDHPIDIMGKPEPYVAGVLSKLDGPVFTEILTAIEQHEKAMDAIRLAEKNGHDGEMKSSAISPSPVITTGDTNGSQPSIEMSTPS